MIRVLIETLWNVNLDSLNTKYPLENRINRNIVECKYIYTRSTFLWCIVLIETLWNVNYDNVDIIPANGYRINRNIVECKYSNSASSWAVNEY